jgi:phosphatidylglycerol---prolipoprotein diacylglyceryl transferase
VLIVEFFESRTTFVTVGTLHIYWYGVFYVLAFWAAWFFLPFLGKMRNIVLSRDQWTSVVAWGALGVLVGGRLGYVLLYEPGFFLTNPLEIVKIWRGGMSSHGGFVGVVLFVWLACRKLPVSLLALADVVVPIAALGLALGRLGNVINQEFGVYAWYEGLGDLLIALFCYVMLRTQRTHGVVFALFLFFYGVQRFLLEYLRFQEWPLLWGFSRGQVLTIPILIIAVLVLSRAYKRRIY